MARMRKLIQRVRNGRRKESAAIPQARNLGEPPAHEGAGDAELDALRGELMRELDRMASEGKPGGAASPQRRP